MKTATHKSETNVKLKKRKSIGKKNTGIQTPEQQADHLAAEYPQDSTAEYSLQFVATVAASLLSGDDYYDAAQKAFALIEACDTELSWRREGAHIQVEFVKAICLITGQKTEKTALPLYRRFLLAEFLARINAFRHLEKTKHERGSLAVKYWDELRTSDEDREKKAYNNMLYEIRQMRKSGLSLAEVRLQRWQFKVWCDGKKRVSASERGRKGAEIKKAKKKLESPNRN